MAARVGEMVAIIRVQDFASRQLRRVGTEFAAMSRQQQMFETGRRIKADKEKALTRQAIAQSNARRVNFVRNGVTVRDEMARQGAALERLSDAERVALTKGRFRKGISRDQMREFQNASRALDQMGLRGVKAYKRLTDAQHAFTQAQKSHAMTVADTPAKGVKGHAAGLRAQAAAMRDVNVAQRELTNAQRVYNALPVTDIRRIAAFKELEARAQKFEKIMGRMSPGMQALGRNTTALGNAMFKSRRELQAAADALDANTRAQMAYNTALRNLPYERLDRLAHSLSSLGRTMQLTGAIGIAALGLAAKAAADFNTELSLAATQARDIDAPVSQVATRIEQLGNGFEQNGRHIKGVLDLMQEYPARSAEMTAATYDIFSSMNLEEGKIMDVAKGMGLLETANKIAVAGGGSLEEATQAMITVFNNFDPQLKNTTEQLDTMFDIVRFGRMRLGDFNTMMNKIAPAAADAGNTLRDVGGAMAFLTTVMPSQRMVATGISRLMEALRHPDVVKGLHDFGVEVKTAEGKLKPLDEIMKSIAETFPAMKTGAMSAADFFRMVSAQGRGGKSKGVIFTQEGRRALSQIITHMDQYLQAQGRIDRNTNEFANSLKAQQQALGVQWATFTNRLHAIVIAIGTDAIPAFQSLGQVLTKLLDAWQSLDDDTRQSIVRFAVFASAGTLVLGVVASLVGGLLALEAMFRRFGASIGTGTGMLRTFWMLARRMMAIGTIVLALKVIKTGDASGWEILAGIAMGAAAGARFGPLGALAGGLVIPITLAMSKDSVQEKWIARQKEIAAEIRANAAKGVTEGGVPALKEYNKQLAKNIDWMVKQAEGFRGSDEEFKKFTERIMKTDFTALEKRQKIIADFANAPKFNTTPIQAAQAQQNEVNKDQIAAWKKFRVANKQHQADMKTFHQDMEQYTQDMEQWNESLRQATRQAGVTAVDNLRNMYMEMEAVNREAFGALFEGPWLTSETFDIAKEWGITASVEDMIKDLNMQADQFGRWRARIDKLLKRGLPREFVEQLEAKGIEEGSPLMAKLLTATPAQMTRIIAAWKRGQGQIQSATKMDFKDEIQRFKDAGGNMGDAIINGFEQAGVAAWFDNWVKATFPAAISAAVATAVAEFKASTPPPTRPTHPGAGPTRPAGGTAKNPGGVATARVTPWMPNQQIHNTNFTQNFYGPMDPAKIEAQRQASFAARNAFRGLF